MGAWTIKGKDQTANPYAEALIITLNKTRVLDSVIAEALPAGCSVSEQCILNIWISILRPETEKTKSTRMSDQVFLGIS